MSDQKYNQGILKAQERLALQAAAGSAGQLRPRLILSDFQRPRTRENEFKYTGSG